MRNFETPKMNISMFAAENVATTASGEEPQATNTDNAKQYLQEQSIASAQIFEFNY